MQSYPDPNAGAGAGSAPFYSTSGAQQTNISNSDELQITAQLSRGLEPMMNAGQGGNMADNQQDPRGGPNQGNVNNPYEGLPHPGQMQAVHGPMDQIGGGYDAAQDGSMAPRKRSKVSRACDECRRKKIRCDATGESENEQCANCSRNQQTCQFSRVPMKRGPSKGYIKELADRLNTLESAVHSGDLPMQPFMHPDGGPRRPSEEFSPPPQSGRKRSISGVSNDFGSYPPNRPPGNWPSPEPLRHLAHPPHPSQSAYPPQQGIFKDPNYGMNGLQGSPDWKHTSEQHQDTSFEVTQDLHLDHPQDWDEALVEGYYLHIHPTFIILQTDRSRLHARLDAAPLIVKAAFYQCLYAAVRPSPASMQRPGEFSTNKVAQLLMSARHGSYPPSLSTDLILLQAMLLLAIATNNSAYIVLKSQALSPKLNLADAVDAAYSLKLHQYKSQPLGDDPDSDDKIARRLWFTLVTMDRWYAANTCRPPLIPDYAIIVYPEDQIVLGEARYQLARLSLTLAHAAQILTSRADLPLMSFNPAPLLGDLLRGELERTRESFSSSLFPPTQAPVLHMCYWFLRILVELTLEESSPTALADTAINLVTQLKYHSGVFSPLLHYCRALVALTFIELLEYEKTRDTADAALKGLLEPDPRVASSSWDTAVRDMISNRLQGANNSSLGMSSSAAESSQHAAVASQSLQRLADLATATEGRDVAGGEDRKEGGEKSNTIPATTSTPVSTRITFAYFGNLRKAVSTGILNALIVNGESAR